MVSAAILIPIAVAALLFWHEWKQRKLPWPDATRKPEDATGSMRSAASLTPGTNPNQTPAPLRSDEP